MNFTNRNRLRPNSGMTLVEVLVTIFILLLIFAFAYQSLYTMLITRELVPKEVDKYSSLERVFDRIEYDFINTSLLSPIAPNGYKLYPIMVSKDSSNGALAPLTISRFANVDYAYQDGMLIGYRLKNNTLEILIWDKLYMSPAEEGAKPKIYPLLENVKNFNVSIKPNVNQGWTNIYPNIKINTASTDELTKRKEDIQIEPLPIGLKIEIELLKSPEIYSRIINRLY